MGTSPLTVGEHQIFLLITSALGAVLARSVEPRSLDQLDSKPLALVFELGGYAIEVCIENGGCQLAVTAHVLRLQGLDYEHLRSQFSSQRSGTLVSRVDTDVGDSSVQVGYLAYGLLAILGTFLPTRNFPLPAFDTLQVLLIGLRVGNDFSERGDCQVFHSEVNAYYIVFFIGNLDILV